MYSNTSRLLNSFVYLLPTDFVSQLLSSARFFLLCEDFEWGQSENLGPVLGSSQALIPRTAPSWSLVLALHMCFMIDNALYKGATRIWVPPGNTVNFQVISR
jgi:hypothetical protein